jgi:hypothetical protein
MIKLISKTIREFLSFLIIIIQIIFTVVGLEYSESFFGGLIGGFFWGFIFNITFFGGICLLMEVNSHLSDISKKLSDLKKKD